jgi:hypothetical protein
MTLRFAVAVSSTFVLALPFACATGDLSEAGPNGSDAPAPPMMTVEGGAAIDQGSPDDAAMAADATLPPDGASVPAPDAKPPGDDSATDGGGVPDAEHAMDGASPEAGTGVLCGTGTSPLRCEGSTPLCCVTGSGSAATYACVATGACSAGYPIACSARVDCAGSLSCCHYNSSIKCESSCPIASSVCDPSVPGSCGSGHLCNVPMLVAGSASPYLTCSP